MSKQITVNALVEGALLAAITAILALIGLWVPPLQFITNLVWTVPIVVVILRQDLKVGILATLVAAILVLLFSDPVRAFFLILQFGGVGIVYGVLFKKQTPPGKTVIIGSLVAAVSMVLMIVLSSWVIGVDFAQWTEQFSATINPVIEMYRQMGMLDRMAENGISEAQLRQTLEQVISWLQILVPGILILSAIVSAALNFLVARAIVKKLGFKVPYVPPFRRWQLPWYAAWGVIVGLGLVLFGDANQLPALRTIGQNIMYVYVPFLFIGGLSVIVYFFKERNWSPVLRVMIIIFVLFYWPVAVLILTSIGLFDPLFNYRKLGREMKE
ncbi:YybS family protein [Metallumcola ferriviriculae]|uniref:YybS family protein n=1 Tax=Metallumcola ferriviriculae TaxID=3039180 RepID=A0AAU0UKH3_9FIRM|nr:YybS family protein [Desulfitibacteraceae bacterium MK1]